VDVEVAQLDDPDSPPDVVAAGELAVVQHLLVEPTAWQHS